MSPSLPLGALHAPRVSHSRFSLSLSPSLFLALGALLALAQRLLEPLEMHHPVGDGLRVLGLLAALLRRRTGIQRAVALSAAS